MNIVFDLDGTLIDSAPDICAIANSILRDLGREALSLELTRTFIGEGAAVLVERMMHARDIDNTGDTHAELLALFVSRYETMPTESPFYAGVNDALDALLAAGHRLGLCTNKPEGPTRAVLAQTGLHKCFSAMVAGGMLDSRKPEPQMLFKVLEDMGPDTALYVGDSETDAETARRAGVPFALFSGGYRKQPVSDIPHDWLFDDFDALPAIVAKLAPSSTPSS